MKSKSISVYTREPDLSRETSDEVHFKSISVYIYKMTDTTDEIQILFCMYERHRFR